MFRHSTIVLGLLCFVFSMVLPAGRAMGEDWSPLWKTTNMSQARSLLAATAIDGKIFFAGGSSSNVVDIYDVATGNWSSTTFSQGRVGLAAASAGGKVFFAGGWWNLVYFDTVDIYDTATGTWDTAALSQAREYPAGTATEGKVFFGGGSGNSDVVDIYDTVTDTWSTATLSLGRKDLAATSANGKVFFGGGDRGYPYPKNVVDIYDCATDSWSTAELSRARELLAAASANNKVLFAGGGSNYYSGSALNTVDIYDISTDTWSTATLSQRRLNLAGTSVGNKVLFAGGSSSSSKVDIFDAVTGTWSTASLSVGREDLAATSFGNQAFFAGGKSASDVRTTVVDIYTLQDYQTINSVKAWTLVDETTVAGRMQLNVGASLSLDAYSLAVGSMDGVAPIDLSTSILIVGSDNTDCLYSGQISGNGELQKLGNGVLALSGDNSYLGVTTIRAGELDLIGPDAWGPILNQGGAYLSGGELVFDYLGSEDPCETILDLLDTQISGSMPLAVWDDTVNERVIVSLAPEPSTLLLVMMGLLSLLSYVRQRRKL